MLKRKNDRQPPQSLDELYPDDYWLDEEDGEELPDPVMKRKPVSGRLHDEPMVTGYEALERQRGVRRPNRKLTRREKKALKRAQYSFFICGRTSCSIKRRTNVDFPVRTGPTTPM